MRQESYEDSLIAVTDFYLTDFDATKLKLHLDVLASNFPASLRNTATVMDVRKFVQAMPSPEKLTSSHVASLDLSNACYKCQQ